MEILEARTSGHIPTTRQMSVVVRPAVDRRNRTTDFKSLAEAEMIGGWVDRREKKSMPIESR